jgi:hypothetical protein
MDESHEEMQLLFLRHLKVVCDGCESDSEKKIIRWVPVFAMHHTTPRVFFEAIEKSGAQNLRNAKGYTHLMQMMRRVTLLCKEPATFTKKMENILQIVNKYPGMAWERVKGRFHLESGREVKNITALGMMVFETVKVRMEQNLAVAALGEHSPTLGDAMPARSDEENNVTIMKYLKNEFIPEFFTIMLRPIRVAFAMATHSRLGTESSCWSTALHTDTIDMIFSVLIHDIVQSPSTFQTML